MVRHNIFNFHVVILFVLITGLFYMAESVCIAKGVKTSYKRYSIFKVDNEDILCEPYTVTKDDWLYKIFRKKGEISEKDFPHFLLIFKKINPKISNIDAIAPGINILIPLKKVNKKEYEQSSQGTVEVPVVEFSAMHDDPDLAPFLKKHTVKKGESVSRLLDKDFLDKSGLISEEGLKAFQLANPNVKNIDIVYEGADIYLPDPSIKQEPWFQSFFKAKEPSQTDASQPEVPPQPDPVDAVQLAQLKKYSSLIGGTLMSRGKMYFPQKDGKNQALDLSVSPVITAPDGSKILVVTGNNMNEQLLASVQAYWKGLKIQMLRETIEQANNPEFSRQKRRERPSKTTEYKTYVGILISQTPYDYIQDSKIPFMVNNIQLEASFGRVIREESTDLLINFGNVYGTALEAIQKKEFEIISITSKQSKLDITDILFSHLGYETWKNPSFFTGKSVEIIQGLYAVKEEDKLFIPLKPLTLDAIAYLKKENIQILSTQPITQAGKGTML